MRKTERSWPARWTARAARVEDVDLILDLVNARSRKLFGEDQATRESIAGFLTGPRQDLHRDVCIVLDEDACLAGIAFAVNPGPPYADIACAALAHPRHELVEGFVDRLQAWALCRATELASLAPSDARIVASAVAVEQDAGGRAALIRAGFRVTRVDHHMRLDLDAPCPVPSWPTGVSVRTADPATDVPALASVYREAWREHAGYVETSHEEVRASFISDIESRTGPIDPSLWFLALDQGQVVGMSLGIPSLPANPAGGYVYQLGVRPAWRKRGIALALLRHTFAQFQQRGYGLVELDVDVENVTGALRLYERAGMRPVRSALSYELELRPRGCTET